MRILVDWVPDPERPSVGRLWTAALARIGASSGMEIAILDRGGAPGIVGAERVSFPAHAGKYDAYGSAMIEDACRACGADLFLSTGYTTPLSTPSIAVLSDLMPDRFGSDTRRECERWTAIAHGVAHICLSPDTRADLLAARPDLADDTVGLACAEVDLCGQPAPWRRYGSARPYYVLAGPRLGPGRPIADLVVGALATLRSVDLDVICIDGSPTVEPGLGDRLPAGCRLTAITADGSDLARLLGDASALVYTLRYRDHCLPVLEALAYGCPIVTWTGNELADPASWIEKPSVAGVVAALRGATRRPASGTSRPQRDGTPLSAAILSACKRAMREKEAGWYSGFYDRWADLRRLQAEVDTLL